jgi:hypothetical protein
MELYQRGTEEKQASKGNSKSVFGKGGSKSRPWGPRKKKNSGGKDGRDTGHNCGKKRH